MIELKQRTFCIAVAVAMTLASSFSLAQPQSNPSANETKMSIEKTQVVDLLKSIEKNDLRATFPRFSPIVMTNNQPIIEVLTRFGAKKGEQHLPRSRSHG